MPEMEFNLLWPDGVETVCYSPSLVVEEHLVVGQVYAIPDLLHRSRLALNEASDRVQARYGFPCSRALNQLATIEERAGDYNDEPGASVMVSRFHRLDGAPR
jgi:uncharacterized repeat protein (TIGR04042 family)